MESKLLFLELARIEFGLTAMLHYLLVPLTLGLPWVLLGFEILYFLRRNLIYRSAVNFWGKFFILSFFLNFATEKVFQYQYSHNWIYFSHVIQSAFGLTFSMLNDVNLAVMLIFVGLFLVRKRVASGFHLIIILFMAISTAIYIVNPMIMNSWMQNPVSYSIDYNTMNIHVNSYWNVYTQPLAIIRVAHLLLGCFLSTSIFMLAISSYYIFKAEFINFSTRTFFFASIAGLLFSLLTLFSGDANGLAVSRYEPEKIAAIEGQWETQKAPAYWYLTGFPDQKKSTNYYVVKIPYLLSLIVTHSLNKTVKGLDILISENATKIQEGIRSFSEMKKYQKNNNEEKNFTERFGRYIGYALLLKKYNSNISSATSFQIQKAAKDTIPQVATVFWAFRIMLLCWLIGFLISFMGVFFNIYRRGNLPRWFLRASIFSVVIPYVASESGWLLTEVGRQPWVIRGILPTLESASPSVNSAVIFSFPIFLVLLLSIFFGQIYLMLKLVRKGPEDPLMSRLM